MFHNKKCVCKHHIYIYIHGCALRRMRMNAVDQAEVHLLSSAT